MMRWDCVDYRSLNKKTVTNQFPLPRVEESIDAIGGAQLFSTTDLASGFNRVAMDEEDAYGIDLTVLGRFKGLCKPAWTILYSTYYLCTWTFDEHTERQDFKNMDCSSNLRSVTFCDRKSHTLVIRSLLKISQPTLGKPSLCWSRNHQHLWRTLDRFLDSAVITEDLSMTLQRLLDR